MPPKVPSLQSAGGKKKRAQRRKSGKKREGEGKGWQTIVKAQIEIFLLHLIRNIEGALKRRTFHAPGRTVSCKMCPTTGEILW